MGTLVIKKRHYFGNPEANEFAARPKAKNGPQSNGFQIVDVRFQIAESNKSELFESTGYQLRSSRHWAYLERKKVINTSAGKVDQRINTPARKVEQRLPVPPQEGPGNDK